MNGPKKHTLSTMTIPNNIGGIVSVIAALSFLTPLVNSLRRWHIDLRKTAKPGSQPAPVSPSSKQPASGPLPLRVMTKSERRMVVFSGATVILNVAFVLLFALVLPPHPATSRDVGQIGLMLTGLILSFHNLDQILSDQRSGY
jgi:hypothetical protein